MARQAQRPCEGRYRPCPVCALWRETEAWPSPTCERVVGMRTQKAELWPGSGAFSLLLGCSLTSEASVTQVCVMAQTGRVSLGESPSTILPQQDSRESGSPDPVGP